MANSASTLSAGVKTTPYWLDTAPPVKRPNEPIAEQADVAVVGGGLTGLSAAIHLADKGAKVALFEKHHVGWGASGRNGGMCTTGASIGYTTLISRYGIEVANRLWCAYNDAIDLVEKLVAQEGIDCNFARAGKLGLAAKPEHFARYVATHEALAKHLNYETDLVAASQIQTEVGSKAYFGGLVDKLGAGLHVGKYVRGMGEAAARRGVAIYERTPVTGLSRDTAGRQRVRTNRGELVAKQVLIATDGYTDHVVPRFQRRIVPVGSFIVATEPLDTRLVDELMPTRRMAADSRVLLYYFRITPDNRMLFGGRAQWALSNPRSDMKSAAILHRGMKSVFPQLSTARIEYAWGGHVGITLDRIPHAGEDNGIYYSLGYNGHGVQMSTFMGKQMADVMDGRLDANPWRNFEFPSVPGHYFGTPWFLPIADAYYRIKDRLN